MSPASSLPKATAAAGLPPRYVYWSGRSGRRYLFTATDREGAADFEDCVAVAVRNGAIVWAGDISVLARMPAAAELRGASVYVHLLAADPSERRAVVRDLRPVERSHLRLAA